MSGIQTFFSEALSLLGEPSALSTVVGILSPAKLYALAYGAYKAVSMHHVEPMELPPDGDQDLT